jgi:hypothetical protein
VLADAWMTIVELREYPGSFPPAAVVLRRCVGHSCHGKACTERRGSEQHSPWGSHSWDLPARWVAFGFTACSRICEEQAVAIGQTKHHLDYSSRSAKEIIRLKNEKIN